MKILYKDDCVDASSFLNSLLNFLKLYFRMKGGMAFHNLIPLQTNDDCNLEEEWQAMDKLQEFLVK